MKTFRDKVVQEVDTITCDKCHKTARNTPELTEETIEFQEFISIKFRGGYGNRTWGDMNEVELDLCQDCQYALFKDFARVTEIH